MKIHLARLLADWIKNDLALSGHFLIRHDCGNPRIDSSCKSFTENDLVIAEINNNSVSVYDAPNEDLVLSAAHPSFLPRLHAILTSMHNGSLDEIGPCQEII
jgi:hypothetical protein